MKVLFVAAEAAPFAKTGGLGDVVGSLPKALRKLGIDARVIMPYYGFIDYDHFELEQQFSFQFPRRDGPADVHLHHCLYDDVPFYFLQSWPQFGSESQVYGGYDWDMPRFIYLSQLAMAAAWEMKTRDDWFPDVFHVHDWHSSLLPFLVDYSRSDPNWAEVSTVLTIHNLAFQGDHAGGWSWQLGIPGRHHPDLVYQDLTDNILAMGIAYADGVTTVSPRYATEIQYPYQGQGLDGLIRTRQDELRGILNGIDVERFDPATDPNIVAKYNAENFEQLRPHNKRELQLNVHLPIRADVPLLGLVSRLETQKGIELLLPVLRRLLVEEDVQFIALGSGDPQLNYALGMIGQDYDRRARTFIEYNPEMAQRIYAGCDLFLMPSIFEPCGIGQMLAMRYGALPLVRETGGLADTVANYDDGPADSGTGFVFNWSDPDALYNTILWALETYRARPDAWKRMQKRAMQTDFSWDKSAQAYVDLYQDVTRKRSNQP
jgi:starch synthase